LNNVVEENSTKSKIKCLGKLGKSFDNVVKVLMSDFIILVWGRL